MHFKLSWHIKIDEYKLGFLDSVEIHKSVDLLADTCTIKLPATVNNKPIGNDAANVIEDKIKRGSAVKVWLGYDTLVFNEQTDKPEFEGYLLNIDTDDGSLILNCEDDLFLMRKPVKDIQFKATGVQQIAEYLVSQLDLSMKVNCTLTINYDKFTISKATAYDVLKKLQDETKGNIYIRKNDKGEQELNIHPPYTEKHGYVAYSFQQNIEKSDLKYKSKEDRKVEIIVERTGKDGKKIVEKYGTTGGEQKTINGDGMSAASMQQKAKNEYDQLCYDGYEGSITTWLIPLAEPGYSASITDEEYEYKSGVYYVNAVTITMDGSGGAARKVQVGKKLVANG